jgi:pimeloyl-ACP methyl ester carboxylesterase
MLNTPLGPRDARRPGEVCNEIQRKTGKRYYHHYFHEPGVADPLMNADIRKTLRSILY